MATTSEVRQAIRKRSSCQQNFLTADCQVTSELGDTTKSFLKPSLSNDKEAQNMSRFAEKSPRF
jgi:hypothetical protein